MLPLLPWYAAQRHFSDTAGLLRLQAAACLLCHELIPRLGTGQAGQSEGAQCLHHECGLLGPEDCRRHCHSLSPAGRCAEQAQEHQGEPGRRTSAHPWVVLQPWRGGISPEAHVQVTFLGVSKKFTVCQEAKSVNSKAGIEFDCLEPHHFVPEVVETYPYEQLSHAVLNWVGENLDRCDVIHGHEWGGSFVDLITASHFRQACTQT